MQPANEQTVLGNFENPRFSYHGTSSRFFKRDGKYFVNTDGPDGKLADYEIKYTFGVSPLQQYLIEFPGGRMQALSIAWDTGKKRWFHLYPTEKITHDDPLHWTGRYQNWNSVCADCHSTNLQKNYDLAGDAYKTTWDSISVGCQSCHGPGSTHVEWARNRSPGRDYRPEEIGLSASFAGMDAGEQVNACAPCHSRRLRLSADDWVGRPLLDSFLPSTLEPEMYHPDGQIKDEVYEYGSFLQSKMYREGVRCVDCHDPHTLRPKAKRNELCVRCHKEQPDDRFATLQRKLYDTPNHHFHREGSPGAQCVNCHMPSKNYMVVDPRRDHSFRVPRPDLSVKIGSPNACNACHQNRPQQWAADMIVKWYGPSRAIAPHYGEAIAAGRAGESGAESKLVALVRDSKQSGIVRATALEVLRRYGGEAGRAMIEATRDKDPLVRAIAVDGLDRLSPNEKLSVIGPLLKDPIRAVRVHAARAIADAPVDQLQPGLRRDFESALADYKRVQIFNGEAPSAHLNLALVETRMKQFDRAVESYKAAIRLDPHFLPARVNLGNLYNQLGRNDEAERVFRDAIERMPGEGELHYSLGLLLAEEGRLAEAAHELRKATSLLPGRTRAYYNLGLALQQLGRYSEATSALLKAHVLDARDRDVLNALVLLYAERNEWAHALPYAQKLVQLAPEDVESRRLLERIQKELRSGSGSP
jgi:tetratricopeptide (TPR) repeat protein